LGLEKPQQYFAGTSKERIFPCRAKELFTADASRNAGSRLCNNPQYGQRQTFLWRSRRKSFPAYS